MLVTDWEDLWAQVDALRARNVPVRIKKVKAHTSDEALATKEQQDGNWQADKFADLGAQAAQLSEAEIRPILKKDSVLWQLQSRMVAIVQQLPNRRAAQGNSLEVLRPTAQQ
eukprot:8302210-Karenia_brevis.AAC.1